MSYITDVQDQIATMLSALQYYKDEGDSTWLESTIHNVAHYGRVEMFGEVGGMDTFKPLEHFVINPEEGVPEFVLIEVSGVRAVREDGSHRILTRALVKGQRND